jgi:hypothetical protein
VGDQGQLNTDKAAGINTYAGLCHTGMTAINLARSNNMRVIAQQEWLPQASQLGIETSSWMGTDEIDMQRSPAAGCAELQQTKNNSPLGGRYFYNNFGKGVLFWQTDAEARCYVNIPDVPSSDAYWMTDANICGPGEAGNKPGVITTNACHVPANYGWQVQRMRSLLNVPRSKPIWSFVELGRPWGEADRPAIALPAIRAAAWHSIIAGAMGIQYFSHSFQPPPGCSSGPSIHRDCPSIRTAVTNLSSEIQGLAPVLFAPYLTSGFTANSNVKALAKFAGGKFYVLAGTAGHIGPVPGNFSIPCVGNATAAVVGESRTVPVNGGAWTDTFADPNSIHIYRIDGGSACGLS